ncbi:MAG: ATPase [Bacteroidales bacterium]|nr:ATPase [Bacteroidales bacterium]
MKTPFVYGKIATGNYFTDRENEIKLLKQNFLHGINTILISPRRWGKSSLVKRAADELMHTEKDIRIIHIDMFNIRSEEEFYKSVSENILQSVSGKIDDIIANTKEFMKQWVPKITISPDAQQEFSFGLNWQDVKKQPDEILDLAEHIATEKGLKIVLCIDEFQNISYFDDPLAFQKKLRSHWQKHQNASYCLYGSKRHMLLNVFTSPSMPFYKFGSLMFLDKIPTEYWEDFIQKQFKATGKTITKKQASQIALMADNHPYYVQQLAQLCWLRTDKEITDLIIYEALESLVMQLSLLFLNLTESLSTTQVNFLLAVLSGVKKFSAATTLSNYQLGTSANVNRIKKALIGKEIIDDQGGRIEILDPVFAIWLKKYYFNL